MDLSEPLAENSLAVHTYWMSCFDQELPPNGKRLGISYVRASNPIVEVCFGERTFNVKQGEK